MRQPAGPPLHVRNVEPGMVVTGLTPGRLAAVVTGPAAERLTHRHGHPFILGYDVPVQHGPDILSRPETIVTVIDHVTADLAPAGRGRR